MTTNKASDPTTRRISLAAILLALPLALHAQSGPPPGFWPSGMKNIATRWNKYCLIGDKLCVERKVLAWGQTCHDGSDRDNVEGFAPPGYRYVSWRCETADPNDEPPGGKYGKHDAAASRATESVPLGIVGSGTITTYTASAGCRLSDGTEVRCETAHTKTCGVPVKNPEQGEVCK